MMATRGGAQIVGLQAALSKLAALEATVVPSAAERGERALSDAVAQDWRGRVPVRTGRLRSGIQVTGDAVVSTAPYTVYVEYGTEHMSAQPDGAKAAQRAEMLADVVYVPAVRRAI